MDFTNVQGAAEFLAEIDFTVNSAEAGDFSSDHVKYQCTLKWRNDAFETSYQSNPKVHGEPTLAGVLAALTGDALCVAEHNIDEFAAEFDFDHEKPSAVIQTYNDCNKTLNWLRDGLGLGIGDIGQLYDLLQEDEQEIADAANAIRADRAAKEAFDHPKAPEGFVTVEDLQKNLDVGDYGDYIAEHTGTMEFVSDVIDRIADDNVDLYNYDLLKWLPDNYEWIEIAAGEGLLEGTGGDLMKMIQAAQYECYTQDMYGHEKDICNYAALETLKDSGVYAVSCELAEALEDIGFDRYSRFDQLADGAMEQVQKVMAANLGTALGDEELAAEKAEELVDSGDFATVNPAALSVEATREVNDKGYDTTFKEQWKDFLDLSEDEHSDRALGGVAKESRAASETLSSRGGHDGPGDDPR